MEISNSSESVSKNIRPMGDTLFIFQNILSFGHSFLDTVKQKSQRQRRFHALIGNNHLFGQVSTGWADSIRTLLYQQPGRVLLKVHK